MRRKIILDMLKKQLLNIGLVHKPKGLVIIAKGVIDFLRRCHSS
jgi:hypothetical protein